MAPPQGSGEVVALLTAQDPQAREHAWEALLSRYSRLIFHVGRSFGGGHDAVMDRYAFVVERLHEDDHRRLRAFRVDGPALFTTWLVIVTRRLCLDHHRLRHGRAMTGSNSDSDAALARAVRWRLVHNRGDQVNIDAIPDDQQESPDETIDRSDRYRQLRRALDTLPARDRLLLYLRYEQGLPAARIATAMGLPGAFHVYRRLRTVAGQLRTTLRATGIDEGEA